MNPRIYSFDFLLRFFDVGIAVENEAASADSHDAGTFARQARPGGWINRLILSAALLLIIYNTVSFLLVAIFHEGRVQATLVPRSLNIMLGLGLFVVARRPFFAHHWREITLAVCLAVVSNETAVALITRQYGPFEAALLLLFVGTGALIPWGPVWQSTLVIFGLMAFAVFYHFAPGHDPFALHRFLTLLTGVGVALFSTSLGKGFRETLAQQIRMLHESQGRLNAEAFERERIIAEREIAERHARESEALLRKVFDATPDVLVVTRLADGRFMQANKEFERTGFSREEAMRSGTISQQRWRTAEERQRAMDRLLREGIVRNIEADFRNRDGTFTPNLVSGALIEIDGEPCGVWINRDITDIRQTQRELIEAREAALTASKFKSEFLSNMSHEMRTPLNAILGMADVLWETEMNAEQREYLQVMRSNGSALLGLIDDVLDLAKVESGRLTLEHARFDLCELLDKVLETFGVRAYEKNLELSGRREPGVPAVLVGDSMRLRQVLVNLIGNAIKFTERGEVALTVAAGETSDELHFTVADTGMGIDRDMIDSIFASFTQADTSTARRYGGSGLGLSIVKQLVELMGGRVWAESEPGQGSVFHFTACFEAIPASLPHPPPLNLVNVRAIVADRGANNRAALRALLEECGANIVEVDSPAAIMDQSPRHGDMVFVECASADQAELERIAAIGRAIPDAIVIPMITADKPHILIPTLRRLGLRNCLVKPVRHADFIERVGTALGVPPRLQSHPMAEAARASALLMPLGSAQLRILLAEDSEDNRMLFEVYGFTSVRRIRQWENENRRLRTPIIALTASALEDDIRECREVGCDAHVAKPARKADIIGAILTVIEQRRIAG